jgi:hypothetical protein
VKFSPVIVIKVPPALDPLLGVTLFTNTLYEKSSSVADLK